MNEEVSRLKASEEIQKVATGKLEEDIKMKETLEQQISQHREQHQKQVGNLTSFFPFSLWQKFMIMLEQYEYLDLYESKFRLT